MILFRAMILSLLVHLAAVSLASVWEREDRLKTQISSVDRSETEMNVLIVSGEIESHRAQEKIDRPRNREEGPVGKKTEMKPKPQTTPRSAEEEHEAVARKGEGTSDAPATLGQASYEEYLRLIQQRIARRRSYPPLARERGIEGRVIVRLVIDPAGNLVDVDILKSDHELLSEGARMTIQKACPFPAPPAHLASRNLKVSVPITYRISEES